MKRFIIKNILKKIYKPMKDAYNRIPQDLYKEFTELKL